MKLDKQKITAAFLLGIFLLSFLGVLIPHVHHSHTPAIFHAYENIHEHCDNKIQQKQETENGIMSCSNADEHCHKPHLHKLPLIVINKTRKFQVNEITLILPHNFLMGNKTVATKKKRPVNKLVTRKKVIFFTATPLRAPPVC